MKRYGWMIVAGAVLITTPLAAQEIGERLIRDHRVHERKVPPKFVIQPPLPNLPGQDKAEKKGPVGTAMQNKMAKDAGAKDAAAIEAEAKKKASEAMNDKEMVDIIEDASEGGETYSHDHGDGKVHSHRNDEEHE